MKKVISILLCAAMMFSMFVTVSAANALAGAENYILGATSSGSITKEDDSDVYKVYLGNAGKISINFRAEIKEVYLKLYDENGNEMWYETPYWNSTTEMISYQKDIHLCKGLYYFSVSKYSSSDAYFGKYDLDITHTAVYESFEEAQKGSNNSVKTSNHIECGDKYIGHISINDDVDVYKFMLPQSGKLSVNFNANLKEAYLKLYDENGNEIWYETPYWNSTTEMISYQKDIHLCKGQYYFSVSRYSSSDAYHGDYEFGLYFTFSNETFSEKQNGSNNKVNEANLILFNQKYNGQLSINDTVDIFRFDCPEFPTISLDANMKRVNIKIYDMSGKEVWNSTPSWNSTTSLINFNEKTKLDAGRYYVSVSRYSSGDEYHGNYTFYLTDGGTVLDSPVVDSVITVYVNGNFVEFDQPPVLESGRTLVPLRAIFEALGAKVNWDGATQTVTATRGGIQISLQIGSTQLYVNGVAKTLDVPAKLISSRTLVPVRAISEAFGCEVGWNGNTQTVTIN